jgi:hypothetical protein
MAEFADRGAGHVHQMIYFVQMPMEQRGKVVNQFILKGCGKRIAPYGLNHRMER